MESLYVLTDANETRLYGFLPFVENGHNRLPSIYYGVNIPINSDQEF